MHSLTSTSFPDGLTGSSVEENKHTERQSKSKQKHIWLWDLKIYLCKCIQQELLSGCGGEYGGEMIDLIVTSWPPAKSLFIQRSRLPPASRCDCGIRQTWIRTRMWTSLVPLGLSWCCWWQPAFSKLSRTLCAGFCFASTIISFYSHGLLGLIICILHTQFPIFLINDI